LLLFFKKEVLPYPLPANTRPLWLASPPWAETDEHRAEDLAARAQRLIHTAKTLNAAFICRRRKAKEFFFEKKNQKTFFC